MLRVRGRFAVIVVLVIMGAASGVLVVRIDC